MEINNENNRNLEKKNIDKCHNAKKSWWFYLKCDLHGIIFHDIHPYIHQGTVLVVLLTPDSYSDWLQTGQCTLSLYSNDKLAEFAHLGQY